MARTVFKNIAFSPATTVIDDTDYFSKRYHSSDFSPYRLLAPCFSDVRDLFWREIHSQFMGGKKNFSYFTLAPGQKYTHKKSYCVTIVSKKTVAGE